MTLNEKSKALIQTQAFGALITFLILSGLYINSNLREFFQPVRYSLLIVLGCYLVFLLASQIRKNKSSKNLVFALHLHAFLLTYGFLLGVLRGGANLIDLERYSIIFVSLMSTLVLINEDNKKIQKFSAPGVLSESRFGPLWLFALDFNFILPQLFLCAPLALLLTGALQLEPIPHLLFDLDVESLYSQDTTKFFAIGSIVFAYLALFSEKSRYRFVFIMMIILMLVMSALGGARGDFVVGFVVVIGMLVRKKSLEGFIALILVFSPLAFYLLNDMLNSFDGLVVVQRLLALVEGESFGERDLILAQSADLLANQVQCLIIGCGFNYFQIHFGYEFGMYPHNIFAETLITFGVFLGGLLVFLPIVGVVYGFFSLHHAYILYWVSLYFLGVSQKSGSLLGLFEIPVIIFFSFLGAVAIRKATKHLLGS